MTVRVGVIGTGMIGQDHIRRITHVVHPSGRELIAHGGVDAVLVTSWGPTHAEHVLAAIAAGKPVFCEKPLATTQEACLRIMDAEMAAGRRCDRHAAADALRAPQSLRPAVRLHHRDDHQRLGGARDRPGAVAVRGGDRGGQHPETPAVNAGYDIRGQAAGRVAADWQERFSRAFDAEFADWLQAVATGAPAGPASWDGYAATAVAESCLAALHSGRRTVVSMPPRPDFYAQAPGEQAQ
jgi:myo-inositol 2-dehydrogenase / D-chiro-inositol 1-dehydrogenase